tara:strand:+ start:1670 stop:2134 length:465 start_codon:yes stop_codon:yes gene_type:complete
MYFDQNVKKIHAPAVKNLNIREACKQENDCFFKATFNDKCYDLRHTMDEPDDETTFSDAPILCDTASSCESEKSIKECKTLPMCYVTTSQEEKKYLPSADLAKLIDNPQVEDNDVYFKTFIPADKYKTIDMSGVEECSLENLNLRGIYDVSKLV